MTSPIETLLFDLRHHNSFVTPLTNLSDPYIHFMHTFQTFTTSLIHALEANDSAVIELAQNYTLQGIYSDLPSFYEQVTFRDWVEDGMLKHPQRRTVEQHQYLHIVELQTRQGPCMDVGSIVASALAAGHEWHETAYDPANLIKDPDALWFFTSASQRLETVSIADDDSCPICTSLFDAHTHIPKRAPCTHTFCAPCLSSWLLKSTLTYSCPLCRACIICGRNPCSYHDLPNESVIPMSLGEIMDVVLVDRIGGMDPRGAELHGMAPETYWVLREKTRKDRSVLKAARDVLGVMEEEDEIRVMMEGIERDAAERIREDILGAVTGVQRIELELTW